MIVCGWPAFSNRDRNPYQSLLYSHFSAQHEVIEFSPLVVFKSKVDVLHLHWPDAFVASSGRVRFLWRLSLLFGILHVMRLRKTAIVWTAHNVEREGQDLAWMNWLFWPHLFRLCDGIIAMNRATLNTSLFKRHGRAFRGEIAVIPHGRYQLVLPTNRNEQTSHKPNIELIAFGTLSSYKRVGELIETFLAFEQPPMRLTVCGKPSAVLPDARLTKLLGSGAVSQRADVTLELGYLSDADLVQAVSNSDGAVFNYSTVINSGAVVYALSCSTPVLVPNLEPFRELHDLVGGGWLTFFKEPLDRSQLYEFGLHARRLRSKGSSGPDLGALEWTEISIQTEHFLARLLESQSSTVDLA